MDLVGELQKYGISPADVRTFGDPAVPELLDYLDLLEAREKTSIIPDGVAENRGRPLLFFINESRLAAPVTEQDGTVNRLRRNLACRGERAYLARVLPGELKVVPVGLKGRSPEWRIYHEGATDAATFYSRLVLGEYDGSGEPQSPDEVFREMFQLLEQGADRLAQRLGQTDVLSLIGRALFFRFLKDRHVINEEDAPSIAPEARSLRDCFQNPLNASETCAWLDRTFNGDFLRLSGGGPHFFEEVGKNSKDAVFGVLSSILQADKPVGAIDYQGRFDWGDFDFAHIPIGLLSQVYEKFVWKWEHRMAQHTSVHYTPRNIAATIVDEAFEGLPEAHKARVLDPACGAGVFLVLAFRRIYRECWRAKGRRPETAAIRSILERQLTGFDISDSALKLSALSLYLTAIELDPMPIPPEKLRFKDLRDRVLFDPQAHSTLQNDASIGSLDSDLDRTFRRQFDVVLSNPPWTSLPAQEAKRAQRLTDVSQDVIRRMGYDQLAAEYHNPDNAPDLPFLWKSTEWCRTEGRIAMALPSRILLKQEPIPRKARATLFQLVEVTGIINGSNLSDTNVWPEMQQPFMLLFARNRRPKAGYTVRFVTPMFDPVLNNRGEIRIDSKSSQPVEPAAATESPWLWKALAVGTSLDIDIVRKIRQSADRRLGEYWENDLKLISRNGYQIKPNQKQRDASFLKGLPDLHDTERFRFIVRPDSLPRFTRSRVCWPREPGAYKAPLVLVKESPGIDREDGWALLSFSDIAFDQSFYGYSAAGHKDGRILARYIHLIVHSLLWLHYALLTSPKFGAERRSIYKSVLDDFPVVPLSKLDANQRRHLSTLSKRLEKADGAVFGDIDAFVGSLYGLDDTDLQVVRDTITVCLPYRESRRQACKPPTDTECEIFRQTLESLLMPFFKVLDMLPTVTLSHGLSSSNHYHPPFRTILISSTENLSVRQQFLTNNVLSLANRTGATRIIEEREGDLIVAILNQYRYWTPSRARLLASDILREHTRQFEEG